jgi:hypothetical protein
VRSSCSATSSPVLFSPPGPRYGHTFGTRDPGDLGTPKPPPLGVNRARDKEGEASVDRHRSLPVSGSESCVHTSAAGEKVPAGRMRGHCRRSELWPSRSSNWCCPSRSLHFFGDGSCNRRAGWEHLAGGDDAKVSFLCWSCGRPSTESRDSPVGVASPSSVVTRSSSTLTIPEFAHSVDAGVGTSSPQRRSSSSQAVRSGGLCSIGLLREKERHP